jgi:hypothetical protein
VLPVQEKGSEEHAANRKPNVPSAGGMKSGMSANKASVPVKNWGMGEATHLNAIPKPSPEPGAGSSKVVVGGKSRGKFHFSIFESLLSDKNCHFTK